jgi:hypothetical protein
MILIFQAKDCNRIITNVTKIGFHFEKLCWWRNGNKFGFMLDESFCQKRFDNIVMICQAKDGGEFVVESTLWILKDKEWMSQLDK